MSDLLEVLRVAEIEAKMLTAELERAVRILTMHESGQALLIRDPRDTVGDVAEPVEAT